MEKCRKCGNEFDPNELPPSLRQTLKRCKKCYRAKKKEIDKDWRSKNTLRVKRHSATRLNKFTLKQKAIRWKIRTLYFKIKKAYTSQKKTGKDKSEQIKRYKEDLEVEQTALKNLSLPRTTMD